MKANELRVGNLIYEISNDDENLFQISSGSDIDGVIRNIESFKGVPINDAWILGFGFREHKGLYWNDLNNIQLVKQKDFFFVEINKTSLAAIDFVHQFQNIYFDLTGKELPY